MTRIEVFGLSDVGRKRKHNEDSFAFDAEEGLFIVADGMGGHAAGEVASKITVETIGEFIAATRQKEEATWPFKYNHELEFNSNRLAVAIEKANERVMAAVAAQPWLKGMGTTVVAGLLNEKLLSLAHVGDSRAYLLRDGQLSRLTDDHSWVHEQVAAGILTEEEAKSHPLKNVVTRARRRPLGLSGPAGARLLARRPFHLLLGRPDHDALRRGDPRRCGCREEPPKALWGEKLVDLANEKGGVDNITVVVVSIEAAPALLAGLLKKGVRRRCERRGVGCKEPRRRRCRRIGEERRRRRRPRAAFGCGGRFATGSRELSKDSQTQALVINSLGRRRGANASADRKLASIFQQPAGRPAAAAPAAGKENLLDAGISGSVKPLTGSRPKTILAK